MVQELVKEKLGGKNIGICRFCDISDGEREKENIVYENSEILVLDDKKPKAPIHLLIFPKLHIENINDLICDYPGTLAAMMNFAKSYISNQTILGQSVFGIFIGTCSVHRHLHLQLLVGQELSLIQDHTPGDGSGSGRRQPYELPTIMRESKMNFPLEILQADGKRVVCKQCSSCHGCR